MEDRENASATLSAERVAIGFDEALARLDGLLESTNWPQDIVWVEPNAYRVVPAAMHGRGKWHMLVLLHPSPIPNPEFARRQFEAAQGAGLLVRLYALAHHENRLTLP